MSGGTPIDRAGLWGAVASFVLWGLMPLYWHLLKAVPSFQIIAHRIVWSAVLVLGWLLDESFSDALLGALLGLVIGVLWGIGWSLIWDLTFRPSALVFLLPGLIMAAMYFFTWRREHARPRT